MPRLNPLFRRPAQTTKSPIRWFAPIRPPASASNHTGDIPQDTQANLSAHVVGSRHLKCLHFPFNHFIFLRFVLRPLSRKLHFFTSYHICRPSRRCLLDQAVFFVPGYAATSRYTICRTIALYISIIISTSVCLFIRRFPHHPPWIPSNHSTPSTP